MFQGPKTLGERAVQRKEVIDTIEMRVEDVLEIRSLGDDIVDSATGGLYWKYTCDWEISKNVN